MRYFLMPLLLSVSGRVPQIHHQIPVSPALPRPWTLPFFTHGRTDQHATVATAVELSFQVVD
jgi:hypothetical protein